MGVLSVIVGVLTIGKGLHWLAKHNKKEQVKRVAVKDRLLLSICPVSAQYVHFESKRYQVVYNNGYIQNNTYYVLYFSVNQLGYMKYDNSDDPWTHDHPKFDHNLLLGTSCDVKVYGDKIVSWKESANGIWHELDSDDEVFDSIKL
jgi:hypothetical protein